MDKGISMDILYPFESLEGKEFKDSNDTSIVAKLAFNKNSFLNSTEGRIQGSHGARFLFTGDITQLAEKEIIGEYSCTDSCKFASLDSDVLKVAHHGSKTSTLEEFLKEVSPDMAVISVGKNNSYGHPTQEVLENLNKYGIKVLRTDEMGDIKIISDGKIIKIE